MNHFWRKCILLFSLIHTGSTSAPSPSALFAAPTESPIAFKTPGEGCCSQMFKTCDATFCDEYAGTKEACDACTGVTPPRVWLPDGLEKGCRLERDMNCIDDRNGCCYPSKCIRQTKWWYKCVFEGSVYPIIKTSDPTSAPSKSHSSVPSKAHSATPNNKYSVAPSSEPSSAPENAHSTAPSKARSSVPTYKRSTSPSRGHSSAPSNGHSSAPSNSLSSAPSNEHSSTPSNAHSLSPSVERSTSPSIDPSSNVHSSSPTNAHSFAPIIEQSANPSNVYSLAPSNIHSSAPSKSHSPVPSKAPSASPSNAPSSARSDVHSSVPSNAQSVAPSNTHSSAPSHVQSAAPSKGHSSAPSNAHSSTPLSIHSSIPSNARSLVPSKKNSMTPSMITSLAPSGAYSSFPSKTHSSFPSTTITLAPSTGNAPDPTKSPSVNICPLHNRKLASVPYTCTPSSTISEAFVIGCPAVEYFPDDYLIGVGHGIGINTAAHNKPTEVIVELYDKRCTDLLVDTSTVSISDELFQVTESFDGMTGKFEYDINVKFASPTPWHLMTFDDETQTSGILSFCTKVTTKYSDIEITFQKTIYSLGFDLSDVAFCLGDIAIKELGPVIEEEEDFLTIGVNACLCDELYMCLEGTITVIQNDDVMVCIFPLSEEFRVTNFALSFKNQENGYAYQAVDLGADGWKPNVPTTVSESGRIVQTTTIMVAGLFDASNVGVLVEGVAQLEVAGTNERMRSDSLSNFEMSLNIDLVEDVGCINSMLNAVLSAFK